jgi:hypothetical protein
MRVGAHESFDPEAIRAEHRPPGDQSAATSD